MKNSEIQGRKISLDLSARCGMAGQLHRPQLYDLLDHQKISAFTDVGFLRIAYAYLILSFQSFARSRIIGNTVSALTAQKAFLNNFENVVNHRVNIGEDIKQYRETLSHTSSKIIVWEKIFTCFLVI